MRIPKDLWHLLIHKYFDTLTIYHCQFVSKQTNAEVKKDLYRLKIARTERHAQHLKEKQKEFVNNALLKNARKRVSSTICNNKERKKELQEILKSLYVCIKCEYVHSTDDDLLNDSCKAFTGSNICLTCMSIAPDLYGSPHKRNHCPFFLVKCGCLNDQYSSDYKFWAEHPKIKGVAVSDCSFEGSIAESKHHLKECRRKCLGCEETFLLENIQKHLKKCFPDLTSTGLFDKLYVNKMFFDYYYFTGLTHIIYERNYKQFVDTLTLYLFF